MLLRSRRTRHSSPEKVKPKKSSGHKISFAAPPKPTFMRDNFSSSFRRSFRGRIARPISAPSSTCSQRWIPAPGKAYKERPVSPQRKYPLCQVCTKPWDFYLGQETFDFKDGQEEKSAPVVATAAKKEECCSRLGDNAKLVKQLENALSRRGDRQKAKVLRELFAMDNGKETAEVQEDWHHILSNSLEEQDTRIVKGKNGDKVTIYHPKKERSDRKKSKGSKSRNKSDKHRHKRDGVKRRKSVSSDDEEVEVDRRRHSVGVGESSSSSSSKHENESNRINLTESNVGSKQIEKENMIGRKSKSDKEQQRDELLRCLDRIDTVDHLGNNGNQQLLNQETGAELSSSLTTTTSSSSNSHDKRKDARLAAKAAAALAAQSVRRKSSEENDFFVEIIIDELKRENFELKGALISREEQLTKAAERVQEIVEEKSRLSKRLEKALSRAHEHAENYDEEIQTRVTKYKKKIEELQTKVELMEQRELEKENDQLDDAARLVQTLRRQLEESEESNKNLQTYITNLKQSYVSTFGSANDSEA